MKMRIALGTATLAAVLGWFLFERTDGTRIRHEEALRGGRESVTFIMGDDRSAENQYYLKAAYYFTHDSTESTTYVESSLRSLAEVREWLAASRPKNGRPWGIVNIVTHGNPWTGMSMSIAPAGLPGSGLSGAGERATRDALTSAVEAGLFPALPDGVVDEKTEIRILGCALGRDLNLIAQIPHVFWSRTGMPRAWASNKFQSFETTERNGRIIECRKIEADAWHLFTRKAVNRPAPRHAGGLGEDSIAMERLMREFESHYPGSPVDWTEALARTQPRWKGDAFHRSFDVPIEWIVAYDEERDRPELPGMSARMNWLARQADLQDYVESIGIPKENFLWDIREVTYKDEAGEERPALRARGLCTVICVLKAA